MVSLVKKGFKELLTRKDMQTVYSCFPRMHSSLSLSSGVTFISAYLSIDRYSGEYQ